MKTFGGIDVVGLPDCPKDTIYVVHPDAVGTLAEHPALAQHLAEGRKVLVTADGKAPSAHLVEEVKEAVKRVGRIEGEAEEIE